MKKKEAVSKVTKLNMTFSWAFDTTSFYLVLLASKKPG
jgi:hypothetical protein